MLSEAEHLWSTYGDARVQTDPRFFAPLRMTKIRVVHEKKRIAV